MEPIHTYDHGIGPSLRAPGKEIPRHAENLRKKAKLKVVLFTGGRGSTVLSKQLINNPQILLTLAINGYDDGASTGEVRRFLGDSLGPSDFRKNASRLARELRSCGPELIDLLDLRFPDGYTVDEAVTSFRVINGQSAPAESGFHKSIKSLFADVDETSRQALAKKLALFESELLRKKRPFSFSDCSLGNLVFAGCFLEAGRDFNAAIADYCALLNLPSGIIENVTDGSNAYLVALDHENRIIASEAEIVNENKRNNIKDIYLIDRPLMASECAWLRSAPADDVVRFVEKRAKTVAPNPRLLARIAEADLIIYSPGTQYSSLFPSYMTPALGATIAKNLTAIKLLITNIKEDAETLGNSSVDIINRAVYYLTEKNHNQVLIPCLITHYLINDPNRVDKDQPYIPLGQLDSLEDPRLVRIGNYEDGVTGRHNAEKILTPFIESFLAEGIHQRIALCLCNTDSLNKISQTVLEMMRGGIQNLPVAVTIFYHSEKSFGHEFCESLPFEIYNVFTSGLAAEASFQKTFSEQYFDYVFLFESSGMYKGEDIVNLASLLTLGRLDAVWGSRRLSVKDIHHSYKLRYRKNLVLGAISYIGSHVLSVVYLILYGRYVSDTLSAVRAVRASYLRVPGIDLTNQSVNQRILSALLRDRADFFETPVQFFSLSPEKVRRTTVLDGLRSLLTILWWKFKPLHQRQNVGGFERTQLAGVGARHAFAERKQTTPLNVTQSSG